MAILFPSYALSFVFHSILGNSIAKHVQQLFLKRLEHLLGPQHYPRMIYCYRSIFDSLQQLILRDNCLSDCEKWHNRSVQDSILEDIYDGQI